MIDPMRVFALAAMLGALGMWMILPRRSEGGRWTGGLFIAGALGLGTSQLPWLGNWVADATVFLLAGVTILAGITTVTLFRPVHCVMGFAVALVAASGLFIFCGGWLLAAIVVVALGAILLGCFFVLQKAQPLGDAPCDRASWEPLLSATTGVVIVAVLSMTICSVTMGVLDAGEAVGRAEGVLLNNYLVVGTVLFGAGLIGLLSRRNTVVMLLAAELMLLGVLLGLAAFGRLYGECGGRMLLLGVALAASEGTIGLALVWMLYGRSGGLDVAVWHTLRESNQPPFEQKSPTRETEEKGKRPRQRTVPGSSIVGRVLAAVSKYLPRTRVATTVACTPGPPRGKSSFGRLGSFLIVRPLFAMAAIGDWIDRMVIDGVANLCGWMPKSLGAVLRPTQSGLIQFYALAMALGLLVLMGVLAV